MNRHDGGFTLIELLVVMVCIGIFAAMAIPYYTKTVEYSKADAAMSAVQMVGTTNRMYALDHSGSYTAGVINSDCNNPGLCCSDEISCASGAPMAVGNPCNLVACKYIANQPFDEQPYLLRSSNPGQNDPVCGANAVACTSRRNGASPGTDTSPYNSWRYVVDRDGRVTRSAAAGADLPPPPPS